jgi:hypothetical protein
MSSAKSLSDFPALQATNYTTNHIIMAMGGDFQDRNAHEKFKNLDKLIKYVNMQVLIL